LYGAVELWLRGTLASVCDMISHDMIFSITQMCWLPLRSACGHYNFSPTK